MFEKYREDLARLVDYAWRHPEPGFREFACSESQVEYLKKMGFDVRTNVADTVTGYVASWGEGKPVIAILGEFDALYGLSQKADCPVETPDPDMNMGQGCGHHLLGVGAIAAGLMLRDIMREKNLSGTIRIYGCPGEESGSGKAYMARDGFFDDCDAALTWHPSNYHMVSTGSSQSCIQCYFRFKGVASHAAGAPQLGRSALDAVELMNVGVNYLREHMEDTDRVHYAITDAGGASPNVVQARAESRYFVRSTTNPKCQALYERVKKIAQGAALMTDTELEVVFDEGLSNTVPNFVLENLLDEVFREVGVPEYTPRSAPTRSRLRTRCRSTASCPICRRTLPTARSWRKTFAKARCATITSRPSAPTAAAWAAPTSATSAGSCRPAPPTSTVTATAPAGTAGSGSRRASRPSRLRECCTPAASSRRRAKNCWRIRS